MLPSLSAMGLTAAVAGTTRVDVAITILVGYLLGSLPVANFVAGRAAGIDLREVGDRNPGYWNALQTLGRRGAVPVLVGDLGKGASAALMGLLLADSGAWGLPYIGTAAAMVGHSFPLFARFRGGRSVLVFVGGALIFAPLPFAVALVLATAVVVVSSSWELGIRLGFVAFPIVQLVVEGPWRTAATGVLMSFIGLRFAMAARVGHSITESTVADQE